MIANQQLIKLAVTELAARNRLKNIDFVSHAFLAQKPFILDESKRKSAKTNRRAGKTNAAAILIFHTLSKNPNSHMIYIGLTSKTARDVIIDAIKEIDKKFQVGCNFYKTFKHAVVLPNNSTISFFGLDVSEKEKEKILGQKNILAIIDESASYSKTDLQSAIKQYIAPTLIDTNGTLCTIGTPGNNRNYFCDITEGRIPGWSNHAWLASDNPFVAEQMQAEIQDLFNQYGKENCLNDPGFRQHYLGEWTIDSEKIPYPIQKINLIQSPPVIEDMIYTLSVDLGWNDENSFVISGWSPLDKHFYIFETYSKNKLLMDEIIQIINNLKSKYNISYFYIDEADKGYVQDLKYRSGIPFKAATKTDKMNYVYMMASDYRLGKIKIVEPNCQSLINECKTLSINTSNPMKPKIVGGDHNADAALYAWRAARNYLYEKPIEKPVETQESLVDDFFDKLANQIREPDDLW